MNCFQETQISGERSVPIIQTGIPAVRASDAEKKDETAKVTEIKVEHQQ